MKWAGIQDSQQLEKDHGTIHQIDLLLKESEVIYQAPVWSWSSQILYHLELHEGSEE